MTRAQVVLAYIDAVMLTTEISDAMMTGWKFTDHSIERTITRRRFAYLNNRIDELERKIECLVAPTA